VAVSSAKRRKQTREAVQRWRARRRAEATGRPVPKRAAKRTPGRRAKAPVQPDPPPPVQVVQPAAVSVPQLHRGGGSGRQPVAHVSLGPAPHDIPQHLLEVPAYLGEAARAALQDKLLDLAETGTLTRRTRPWALLWAQWWAAIEAEMATGQAAASEDARLESQERLAALQRRLKDASAHMEARAADARRGLHASEQQAEPEEEADLG